MDLLNIADCLSSERNEELLKMIFCCQFEENDTGQGAAPELGYFVRLVFDCRNGKLFTDVYSTQDVPQRQLFERHGEASVHFIPVFSLWINGQAPAFFHWPNCQLYPSVRMEIAGWSQWREEAESLIRSEYGAYAHKALDWELEKQLSKC